MPQAAAGGVVLGFGPALVHASGVILRLLRGALQKNDQGSNGGTHFGGSDLGSRSFGWTERAQ